MQLTTSFASAEYRCKLAVNLRLVINFPVFIQQTPGVLHSSGEDEVHITLCIIKHWEATDQTDCIFCDLFRRIQFEQLSFLLLFAVLQDWVLSAYKWLGWREERVYVHERTQLWSSLSVLPSPPPLSLSPLALLPLSPLSLAGMSERMRPALSHSTYRARYTAAWQSACSLASVRLRFVEHSVT